MSLRRWYKRESKGLARHAIGPSRSAATDEGSMNIPTYAINLDSRPDRWRTLSENLDQVGLTATRIRAETEPMRMTASPAGRGRNAALNDLTLDCAPAGFASRGNLGQAERCDMPKWICGLFPLPLRQTARIKIWSVNGDVQGSRSVEPMIRHFSICLTRENLPDALVSHS